MLLLEEKKMQYAESDVGLDRGDEFDNGLSLTIRY